MNARTDIANIRIATESMTLKGGISIDEGQRFDLVATINLDGEEITVTANELASLLDGTKAGRKARKQRPTSSAGTDTKPPKTEPKEEEKTEAAPKGNRNSRVLALIESGRKFTAKVHLHSTAKMGRKVLADDGDNIQIGMDADGFWYGPNHREGSELSERGMKAILNRSEVTALRRAKS